LLVEAYGLLNRTCREADVDGTPFGRYRLVELPGRRGMGEVWRAYDTVTNRVVAIKLLSPHLAEDDTLLRRFRRVPSCLWRFRRKICAHRRLKPDVVHRQPVVDP
jgi:serine/threonine protein kinase